MELTVNFADVQTRALIPAGDYSGIVTDCVLKEKTGKEHPYLNFEVTIAEGDHEGRKLYLVASFQPNAMWKMMETFQNLGLTDLDYKLTVDDQTMVLTEPEVIGLPCVIQVFQEPYNKRMTSKISNILGPNGENFAESGVAASEAAAPEASAPAARPATKATPAASGPAATAAKRSPFPAAKGPRTFKA